MPRIIDVIHHNNVAEDELAYREPQQGGGDWRMGSQVIVNEAQAAVFVRAGQALDALGPGRHTLSVANLPILSGLIGLATSGRTPFTADLYFVNMRNMPQVQWGTVKPIYINATTGLGILLLRTHGVLGMRVDDPNFFVREFAMNRAVVRMRDIKDRIQTTLIGALQDLLLTSGAQTLVDANRVLSQIEGAMLTQLSSKFEELGLKITAFESNPFDTITVPIEELRDLVPLETWMNVLERQKRLDIGMEAARNPGMGGALAGAGVGLGVGQQIGAALNPDMASMQQQMMQQNMMMQQMMQQMMNNNNQQQGGGSTPTQAAPSNPQTKEEIQAFIDNLDLKLMNGEISEDNYNRLIAKWQQRLDSMG